MLILCQSLEALVTNFFGIISLCLVPLAHYHHNLHQQLFLAGTCQELTCKIFLTSAVLNATLDDNISTKYEYFKIII